MTDAQTRPVEATAVVTGSERELAVAQWLLSAADDRERARAEWGSAGLALLRCGGILGAVGLPARLVWSAAGSEELMPVDAYLSQALEGPVFMDLHTLRYYALVPPRSLERFPLEGFPGAAHIGRDHYLGVPDVRRTTPRERSYWCVPMNSPGVLCPVEAVEAMARAGRTRMVEEAWR
ncbi:hypothetical protein HTV45_27535 [Streptomyces sp. CHD11]|uniref:hypothetical protein n=1 Tax=Streptomyces sp. CHD11 TaxID=2741325 RepID=UPI001BFC1E39|nr:hypothetical protein [Streptomyces sp. CHD11]MBT3154580.1 hypothetical protein [Streptomyces sp. CHD11]